MTVLAYRRIAAAGRLMVVLWVGMLVTVGLGHRHWPDPFRPGSGLRLSASGLGDRSTDVRRALGMALAIAMYDFLGYYQVCYWATRSPMRPDHSALDPDLGDRGLH